MKFMRAVLCVGIILCASQSLYAQQNHMEKAPADTAGVKIKIPRQKIHQQKEQPKKIEDRDLKLPRMYEDLPLLMKEKDSLQSKSK